MTVCYKDNSSNNKVVVIKLCHYSNACYRIEERINKMKREKRNRESTKSSIM